MIIKNYEVAPLGRFLFDLKLKGKESRMRTRFINILEKQLELINRERELLLSDYSKKDENGESITEYNEELKKDVVLLEDGETYNNEVLKLMNEDFIIEETADKIDMLQTVQGIVLNVDLEFSGQEAMQYDRFCQIVEDITLLED